ncbi:MAG: polyprenol monophosphomannose synthase [Nanoarchaeota archaeon]|nr:polyprenol monophosphomannose synthase [Nanoarchaeota archaeon]MBU1269482.1 polyprenol monophosphomannose synthase [Nanoarchaeota archaeon]MBU1603791.1 polyprenol monophosphomannose synthase [Nanoarchaeota archaeon]MBU2443654.1 polyprenol monophosphomannose synthase [Nanoarchaeota archaeon]
MISIIIPTFNEANNISLLIPKIYDVLDNHYNYEIIVVDDNSPDGTAKVVRRLGKKYSVRLLLRKNKRGLSSAVIDGFNIAKGDLLCVMDADLSHPPELLSKIILLLNKNDLVIGSRLVKGGGSESWPIHRKIISWCAQLLARPLTPVKDAMSGFFALKKSVINNVKLEAYGYKILLEILVVGNYKKVAEVPFTFLNRTFGKSKIGVGVEVEYIKQLAHLYEYKFFNRTNN